VGVRIPWHVDGRSLRRPPAKRSVSVSKHDGDPVVGDWAAVEAGVLATARRNVSLFGEGTDSLYRLGPFSALVGRPVATLRTDVEGGTSLKLDDQRAFDDVRISSGLVPARIAGEIDHRSSTRVIPLAIAVNGRVEATTWSYVRGGRSHFIAMVPDDIFHDGKNPVSVYAVRRGPDGLTLSLLGGTAARRA
jgi:hypothetical protein